MHIHRAFNNSYIHEDSFIKLSHEDRLNDEIAYYQMISKFPQKKLFAEFRGNISNGLTYALKLKNYDSSLNFFQKLIQNDKTDNFLIFNKLIKVLSILHQYPHSDVLPNFSIDKKILNYKMLIEKTLTEFNNLKKDIKFTGLLQSDFIEVNDKKYDNFVFIWNKLKEIIEKNYLDFDITLIHGDLCFSNILVNQNNLHFVDPRGSYGLKGCFGDKAYDYAKILHSLDGNYEQIIYDNFKLTYNECKIDFTFEYNLYYLIENIKNSIPEQLYIKSQLIQGLIYIGMCARHNDSFDRQLIMYSTGIRILNEWLKEHYDFLL